MPENATLVQLDASYTDVFEAEYFRKKGLSVEVSNEVVPPVWTTMQREGDKITYRRDGELHGIADLRPRTEKGSVPKAPGRRRRLRESDLVSVGSGMSLRRSDVTIRARVVAVGSTECCLCRT